MPKLHLITYGCQMNEYDSERVAGLLKREHYELTEVAEEADLVLLNTCALREKAEDKVFSRLGQLGVLKRQRPDLLIGVMGCMAQLWQGKILDRAPHVDLVFGSAVVSRVGELVERARTTGATILETGEAPLVKITAKPDRPGQLKAFVTDKLRESPANSVCAGDRGRGASTPSPPSPRNSGARGRRSARGHASGRPSMPTDAI
jgi:tRNA-2-methylthio-N6-dimethylallyladenosine synthase